MCQQYAIRFVQYAFGNAGSGPRPYGSVALAEWRDRWLNPPEWVEWAGELVSGYPQRPVARDEAAAKELKTRTLTNLYNARPQWLADAHVALGAAVATAYGWDEEIPISEALGEIMLRNLMRVKPNEGSTSPCSALITR